MQQLVNDNKVPSALQFDLKEGTYKAVGDFGTLFTRLIGNLIGDHVSLYYDSWQSVPNEHKIGLMQKLKVNLTTYSHVMFFFYNLKNLTIFFRNFSFFPELSLSGD